MLRYAMIGVAVLAGGGAAWLAFEATWREPPKAKTVIVAEPTVEVLAPNMDLSRGSQINAAHLTWSSWPKARLQPGMILRDAEPDAIEALSGRTLRSNLYAAEPLRRAHLSESNAGYMALMLQPQMRAIGVPISAPKTAGGFILPNDRVDIMHTVVRDVDGDGRAAGATRTILTNVRVLAIGLAALDGETPKPAKADGDAEKQGGGRALRGDTATLELTPEQAEVLLSASTNGQLTLALRAAEDFGLSGIGDLTMIEGRTAPEPVAAPVADDDEGTPRRITQIIASGAARNIAIEKGGEDD